MAWETILSQLKSNNLSVVNEGLVDVLSKSKCGTLMESFHAENGFNIIYDKFCTNEDELNVFLSVLSILGDCFYVSFHWRQSFYEKNGIDVLANHLYKQSNDDVISKLVRMLGNLTEDRACLHAIQNNSYLVRSVVKHGICKSIKTQLACLRSLRKICVSKASARYVADYEEFPTMLLYIYSPNMEVVMLCLKLLCSLLKTQIIEVCHRAIEHEILFKILEFAKESVNESLKNLCIEILYLITLNSACRVTVASAGAIQIFIDRIKSFEFDEIFKCATRGLCLCAREAVNRNKMKMTGALSALVDVLRNDKNDEFRESIVASFVWFLFDDKSLALLIRAEVVPALLNYIDDLTMIEFRTRLKMESEKHSEEYFDGKSEKDGLPAMPLSDSMSLAYNENPAPPTYIQENLWESPSSRSNLLMTSPETSPYYPDSPQYSLPSFSPHMSPESSLANSPPRYSPPHSPPQYSLPTSPQFSPPTSPLQFSPEYQGDGYFSDTDSSSSLFKKVPYHFQSADGIHAMIHGTRGPIHDTLLLLSRFSQAKDPSSFFLYQPGFNSLLNYLLLSPQPNQKCARILNRLTLNSHCFDVMVKKRLIPNLYLRLCTGHSLEYLASILGKAKDKYDHDNYSKSSDSGSDAGEDDKEILFRHFQPTSTVLSLGKLLISNLRSQCESSYGKGVLSHIMLTGSKTLKESCVLSIPYVIWSSSLLKRIFLDFKGVDILCNLLRKCSTNDNTLFVLLVESICSLARSVNVDTDLPTIEEEFVNGETKLGTNADEYYVPPLKKQKPNPKDESAVGKYVVFILPSKERLTIDRRVLSEHSLYFERMFSQRYESEEDFTEINVTDVNEVAFKKLVHFMNGCAVNLNSESFHCDTKCSIKSTTVNCTNNETILQKPEKSFDVSNLSSMRLVTNSSVTNLMHLYACAERYFVDELKENCKNYMKKILCEKTLLPIMLLAYRHACKDLQHYCLVYLLTKMNSPKDRVQSFAEIFFTQEKEEFLKSVHDYLIETIKSKKR